MLFSCYASLSCVISLGFSDKARSSVNTPFEQWFAFASLFRATEDDLLLFEIKGGNNLVKLLELSQIHVQLGEALHLFEAQKDVIKFLLK